MEKFVIAKAAQCPHDCDKCGFAYLSVIPKIPLQHVSSLSASISFRLLNLEKTHVVVDSRHQLFYSITDAETLSSLSS